MKNLSSKLLVLTLAFVMVLTTVCTGMVICVGAEGSADINGKITTVDFNTKSVASITAGEVIGIGRTNGDDVSLLNVSADGTLYTALGRVLAYKNGNAYNVLNKSVNIVVVYDDVNGYARYYVNGNIAYLDDGSEAICKVSGAGVENEIKINDAIVADGYTCKSEAADEIFNYVGLQEHETNEQIRILSGINTVWYESVGYEVEVYDAGLAINSDVTTVEGSCVYESVFAAGEMVDAIDYGYTYFAPLVVSEIAEATVGSAVIVTPFAKAGDVVYEGKAVKITITADGYEVDKNYEKPITDPTVIVGNVSGNVGDEVTVLVDVTNAPALYTMGLNVTYDDSALEWVSVKNGEAMSEFTFTAPSRLKSGANLTWYANDPGDVNGTVLEFKFKIKDTAAYGDYTVAMTCDEGNTFDANNNGVALKVVNGKITVEEPKATVTVGTASGSAGKEVTVLVDVANAPALYTMGLSVSYDESVLEWVAVNSGEAMSEFTFTAPSRLKSGANLTWYANDPGDVNGTVLEFVFKIKSGVELGDYAISLACDAGNTFDANNDSVEFATVAGKVTVEKPKQFVSVGTAEGRGGDEVTVLVDVTDAPDLYQLALKIEFDSEALKLTSVAGGKDASAFTFTPPKAFQLKSGLAIILEAADPASLNGTVLELTFTILDGVEPGEYAVTVTCDKDNTYDANGENVALDNVAGNVTVLEPITDPTIVVGKASGAVGDTVTVTANMLNSPSLYMATMKLTFDSTALKLTSVTNGDGASAFMFTPPKAFQLKSGVTLTWEADEPATVNGDLLVMTFTISDGAEAGNYAVTLTCDADNTYDENGENIDIANISGVIKVTG